MAVVVLNLSHILIALGEELVVVEVAIVASMGQRDRVRGTRVRGTGSADPQQMLIFWELLIFRIINVGLKFLVTRKRLTYHAAITDGIACRPLNYGVWNACET